MTKNVEASPRMLKIGDEDGSQFKGTSLIVYYSAFSGLLLGLLSFDCTLLSPFGREYASQL